MVHAVGKTPRRGDGDPGVQAITDLWCVEPEAAFHFS